VTGAYLIGVLPNFIFSTGSACNSRSTKPSHVLSAISSNESTLHNSFRIGVGKSNTVHEIDYVGSKIIEYVQEKQRSLTSTRLSA
jgi:cysteine desulfurase